MLQASDCKQMFCDSTMRSCAVIGAARFVAGQQSCLRNML